MPTVDIITRTLNRPILLERAIEDVLLQEYEDWHHFIVNDGGDAAPVERLIDKHRQSYRGRVTVKHNPSPSGMEAASNSGVKLGQSPFISIHDDDDTWKQPFLSKVIDAFETLPSELYGGVLSRSTVIDEKIVDDLIITTGTYPFNDWMKQVTLLLMLKQNRFPPISFVFRRSVWSELGGFNEDLPVLGDWDFHLRCLEKYRIHLIPDELANYHHRATDHSQYGNTVHAQQDKHERYRELLIDDWLREGLASRTITRGQMVVLSEMYENLKHMRFHGEIAYEKFKAYDRRISRIVAFLQKVPLVRHLLK